jgi:RNA polymerase sigma-70 factor (ECF subfamily)
LWQASHAHSLGLTQPAFAEILDRIGTRHNHGLRPGEHPSPAQQAVFFRALQLKDLALAQACALGHETAWQQFLERFRSPLTQAAISITGSASLGEDLAGSLYSELFGLTERDGQRRSPLASYSGRGSLMGWLRSTLAQRHVDHHRRTHRETPLEDNEFAATASPPQPVPAEVARLDKALATTLHTLSPEERFLLSAYFLDGRTLLELARLLRVHEATVSRKLKRLTEAVRKQLLKNLEATGLSKRAAQEALGTDPRDLSINLRNVLQTSPSSTFSKQAGAASLGQS